MLTSIKTTLYGTTRRKRITNTLTGLALVAATAAAAWIVVTSGSGAGSFGRLLEPQVSPGQPVPNSAFPGSNAPLAFNVNNPNNVPLRVIAIEVNHQGTGTGTYAEFCTVRSVTGLSIPVPVGQSNIVVPDAVFCRADTPNEAQLTAFTKPSTLTFDTVATP